MHKSTWITILLCVNLVLLTGLVILGGPMPAAYAQEAILSNNYLVASAEIQDQYDAIYILDTKDRTLHAFFYDKGRRRLFYADFRDLERDFRNN